MPSDPAPAPNVQRRVLLKEDSAIPNYRLLLVEVTLPPGGREGRHTHPGALAVYVQEGAMTLEYEGQPTRTYRAGESYFIAASKVHEGINNGTVPVKALATFVLESGKPLAWPVQ